MATAPKTHKAFTGSTPRQQYDKRRGSAQERGYDSKWHKVRAIKVKKNPLCEDCESKGLTVLVDEVDHVVPINGPNDRLLLDTKNLRSRCKACHTKKTKNDPYLRALFDDMISKGADYDGARDVVVERAGRFVL